MHFAFLSFALNSQSNTMQIGISMIACSLHKVPIEAQINRQTVLRLAVDPTRKERWCPHQTWPEVGLS